MLKCRLGDISDIITGPFGSALHQNEYVSNGVPVIMPQDIGNRTLSYEKIAYITEAKAEELSRYIVEKNDIVYARRGDVEKHAFITQSDEGALCGTGCLRVRINSRGVNPVYLSFYLNRPETRKWIVLHAVGSNMANINSEILGNVPLELPDIDEQNRVASFLDNIDQKIINNNRICEEINTLLHSIYEYWFVQYDFPNKSGQPYKSSNGEMTWKEELQRYIPTGWTIKHLGDIIIESDKSTVQVNGASTRGEYPFFTSGNAILSYDEYFVDGFHCFLNTGGNPDIKGYKGKCAYSTDTWCISAEKYSYIMYCYFLMIMPQFEQLFFTGSGLKHLQKDALKKQYMVLPTDDVLNRFNSLVDSMWGRLSESYFENQQITSLRDYLLPMLMNGKVKVALL